MFVKKSTNFKFLFLAQTRRRCILLASAPGYALPHYPEPLHTFAHTSLKVNIKRYNGEQDTFLNDCKWTDSAPYRTITIKDIISDLPAIRNGEFKAAVLKTLCQKLPFFWLVYFSRLFFSYGLIHS